MADPKHIFCLAGESSGDRIGGWLMAGLRERADVGFSGVGGEDMQGQGLASLFPMSDLSVMGYADVIARLPLLFLRAEQVVRHILRNQPDAVLLIDAQVFSQEIAKRLRKRGYKGVIMLYVAPSVWAYKPERAKKIAPLYDEVLSVLPFEPAIMEQLGGPPTSYVGHPATTRFAFRDHQPARGPVMLLPGSRAGELKRHLPLMQAVAVALSRVDGVSGFVIPTPASLAAKLRARIADWPLEPDIVTEPAARQTAQEHALAAFAVSGTATLELALAGVPHAITYVAEPEQVRLFKNGTTSWIGLPNIIARREVVPEILFAGKAEPARALAPMKTLIEDESARDAQRAAFIAMRALMQNGAPEAPRQDPVDRILARLDAR